MHTFKSLLLVAVLVASMCPAFAEDSCEALFAAVDTSRESTVSLEDSHPEIYQSIEEMKARLLKPASKIERVTRLTLAKRMNEITDLLTKFFVHSYSFLIIIGMQ